MHNKPQTLSHGRIVRAELQRKKIFVLIGIQACILFTLIFFLFRRKNNFMEVQRHTFILEKMYDLIDQINEEVETCLKKGTRKEQNSEFSKIDFIEGLTPIRLSEMTAVFDLVGNIGEYLALDRSNLGELRELPSKVIVKRVILKIENSPEEEKISTLLDHPHIVKTYLTYRCNYVNSKGVEQSLLWLFIEPLNTKVSIKENAKKEDEIRAIMRDTLEGLAYMHSQRVAHLDLKLANVMGHRDQNNNITYKIIDFGFSRQLPNDKIEEVYPKRCYGTFPYKSPEVWISSVHGFSSDIWCIGAMSLFLANRKSSYFQKRAAEGEGTTKNYSDFRQFLNGTVKIKIDPETSPELVSFIRDCMKRNREERPTAEKLLDHVFIRGEQLPDEDLESISYYI
ncbi:uncharacterized protein NEMAJ01_2122 [Nematocida major]|uniref:uncharacterized protein n=1 Tax=Nematocida major TaxID=1912982 RepID=UPI002007EA52|nr:uncharacterized protein NEMAJ01_2122 [Nematocida major]KAH9387226.1 hypothetical protein NEMAJ01_2122 [Nematocida major]